VNWSIDPAYAGPGTCSISGSAPSQVLECAFGDMAPGDGASVHVSSATTDASVGTYDNTATAAATNAPPVEASATTKVIAVATVTTVGSTVAPTTTVAETPAQLPFTGGNSQGLLLAGTALVLAGGALALSRRRRQAGQH
jgi:LPXTG-motif cell wall-anchored protein